MKFLTDTGTITEGEPLTEAEEALYWLLKGEIIYQSDTYKLFQQILSKLKVELREVAPEVAPSWSSVETSVSDSKSITYTPPETLDSPA